MMAGNLPGINPAKLVRDYFQTTDIMRIQKLLVLLLGLSLLACWRIGAQVPRAEHPRPDAFRENWTTLNGEWQFEIDAKGDGEQRGLISGKDLAAKIVVPFCPESKLSGVGHYDLMKNVWYRRSFEVPTGMKGQRVRLHFGGVDYRAWVWVNGQLAGSHIGGNVAFAFDITRYLKEGPNELVVRAFDDTGSGRQPTGKQTHTVSEGCVYTRTTGIWQPVWLEAVGNSFVEQFSVVPDPDHSRVIIEAAVNGDDTNLTLTVEAFADGKSVGKDASPASWRNQRLVIELQEKRLWEIGSPFLYDLKFTLANQNGTIDQVGSYFGLRKVSIHGRAILINDKPVFQRLILDQGFYPDGIWTAPSDEALKRDIELSMEAGYNGARLHQKVFEPRFLYWADKLGYIVWGEFPNWGFNFEPANYANVINEWTEILQRDRNHPSIVGWCPFNETPGEAGELQNLIFHETKAIDPTRPVLETSGWAHTVRAPEIRDEHDYNQDPANFKKRWQDFFAGNTAVPLPSRYGSGAAGRDLGVPFMVSEFGGIGWATEGGWGYGAGPKSLEEFYIRYEGLVSALLDNADMFGFCYTQLTDVEQEHNGLYYYDRRPKFDMKRLHAATSRPAAYERTGPVTPRPAPKATAEWKVLVGAAADGDLCKPYRYTTETPATSWTTPEFNDGAWAEARAPFGNLPNVRTPWKTSDIWLRRSFEWTGGQVSAAALVIFHDEDTEVFVNGEKVWSRGGFNNAYESFEITAALKPALKLGRNSLAVHTRQTGGGQFIDLALLVQSESFQNPVYTGYLADPFCWYHDGLYYAVGTRGPGTADPSRDVPMIKSKDLQHWEYVGHVLELPPEERGGAVWAPETAYHEGTFYLYYHADGYGKGFRVRVATSKNPEGPYRDTGVPVTDVAKNDFAIDSHAFRDDDGQWYLFYATDFTNHDATTFRGTALVVDRLIDMTRLEGKPVPVMRAHWSWQIYERNRNLRGEVADWYTLEGPGVIKRGGKYYCFYSGGNYQNDSYGVDYLVADNIRGPWTEVGRERGPQILRSVPGKIFGPGHHSIVSSPDGKSDYLVYHAWNAERTARQVWVDPLVWSANGPQVERFQPRITEMNQKALK
jgi:GH43 family beta-xylosidase